LSDASLINISEDGSVHDFFIDRITFPIFNSDGAIVAFSGRTTSNKEPKYLNSKENSIFSKSKILYNFQNIISQDVDTLIIVEGFMDAIAYHRAGIKNVVATMGTVLTPEHISLIKSLPNIRSVVLSFDNDAAGTNATIINGLKLLEQKIHTFVVGPYDKKYKDVDELLLHNSSEALHQIINNQEDYILFLINTLFSATQHTLANRLNIVEKIIKIMVDNDDVLLKSMHIDALAEFSKLSVKDIEQQYSIILKKKYKEYDYSNDERKNLEECLVENDVPNEEIKDEISVLNYKLNLIGNIISSLLSQLIYFSIKDHKVIDLYDKKIYFNELSSHFPLECKLLKILLIFEHTDNVNENEIINYFRQNDEKNVINVEYYLENLKKIFDFEIKDINNRVVDELINTINIRKIEFINTILSMQIFKEETKPNKDKKTIDEL
jgi:DNA primase